MPWIPISRFELRVRIAREVRRQFESRVTPRLKELEQLMMMLGEKMTAVEDALAQVDAATNEVAAELDALKEQVANFDSATAAKIQAAADRLRSLAADPENPVPEAPPAG